MSVCCRICSDFRDKLYVLPCHPQHSACKDCLQKSLQPICKAIKCDQCRKVNVWIDIDDLDVDGEDPTLEKCSLCDPKLAGAATDYCCTCKEAFCCECLKDHNSLYKNGKAHDLIPFESFQKRLELHDSYCHKLDHNNQIHDCACKFCNTPACKVCRSESTRCTGSEAKSSQHEYTTIKVQGFLFTESLKIHIDALKAKSYEVDDELKSLLTSMEEYRKSTQDAKESLTTNTSQYSQTEVDKLIQTSNKLLDKKAKKVNDLKSQYEQTLGKLTNLQESLTSAIQPSHPATLLDASKQILEQIETTLSTEFEDLAIRPISVVQPAGHLNERAPLILNGHPPVGIEFIRTISLEENQDCGTVCILNDGTIIHGGPNYNSLGIEGAAFRHVISGEEDGTIVCTNWNTRRMEVYDVENKNLQYDKYCNWTPRPTSFTKMGPLILLAGRYHGCIYVYDTTSSANTFTINLDGVRYPRCLTAGLDGQLFVTSDESIYTFNVQDPEGTERRLTSVGGDINSIAYFNYHLFVPRWGNIYIYNLAGERVKTLSCGGIEDISINERGELAIAGGRDGVRLCQLVYNLEADNQAETF